MDPKRRPEFMDDINDTYAEMREEFYAGLEVSAAVQELHPSSFTLESFTRFQN